MYICYTTPASAITDLYILSPRVWCRGGTTLFPVKAIHIQPSIRTICNRICKLLINQAKLLVDSLSLFIDKQGMSRMFGTVGRFNAAEEHAILVDGLSLFINCKVVSLGNVPLRGGWQ